MKFGAFDGLCVGDTLGVCVEGAAEGCKVGVLIDADDGFTLGTAVGLALGSTRLGQEQQGYWRQSQAQTVTTVRVMVTIASYVGAAVK
jgi:hypothetical protein